MYSSVPSPDDCPIRDQKIILAKTNRDSQQSVRVMRDNSCQTELTLPPILPKHVEDVLRPYFSFMQNQQQTLTTGCDSPFDVTTMQYASSAIDHDARDLSLRRKLFQSVANTSDHSTEYDRDVQLDSPAPQTPEMVGHDIALFMQYALLLCGLIFAQIKLIFYIILFVYRFDSYFAICEPVASLKTKISHRLTFHWARLDVNRSAVFRPYRNQQRHNRGQKVYHHHGKKTKHCH